MSFSCSPVCSSWVQYIFSLISFFQILPSLKHTVNGENFILSFFYAFFIVGFVGCYSASRVWKQLSESPPLAERLVGTLSSYVIDWVRSGYICHYSLILFQINITSMDCVMTGCLSKTSLCDVMCKKGRKGVCEELHMSGVVSGQRNG